MSGTGRNMLKQWIHTSLSNKYAMYERNSEDNYSNKDGTKNKLQSGFDDLQKSFYSMANTLSFDMKYNTAYLI